MQVMFRAWFRYFEYFGCLSHGMMLMVLNYCNWSTWPWSIMQQEKISSVKLGQPLWHVWSVTAPSPNIAQILFFLAFQLCFYLCWNNKAWYAKKCCFFPSIFSLKTATQNSLILILFFNARLIWQLSQYNLTKLFQMKLKTTKHY